MKTMIVVLWVAGSLFAGAMVTKWAFASGFGEVYQIILIPLLVLGLAGLYKAWKDRGEK